jgi:hypothetical protein
MRSWESEPRPTYLAGGRISRIAWTGEENRVGRLRKGKRRRTSICCVTLCLSGRRPDRLGVGRRWLDETGGDPGPLVDTNSPSGTTTTKGSHQQRQNVAAYRRSWLMRRESNDVVTPLGFDLFHPLNRWHRLSLARQTTLSFDPQGY